MISRITHEFLIWIFDHNCLLELNYLSSRLSFMALIELKANASLELIWGDLVYEDVEQVWISRPDCFGRRRAKSTLCSRPLTVIRQLTYKQVLRNGLLGSHLLHEK
jgi:hypothetical protein